MLIPSRKFSAGTGYRYGFNGKENDNEVKGEGDQIDFGSRIYDPRLSRWLSVDPLQKKYPNETPYLFTGGNPIYFIDPDGKDRIENNIYVDKNGNTIGRIEIIKVDSWDIISKKRTESSSVMGGQSSLVVKYDWYNVGYNVIHVIDEKGKEISQSRGNDYAILGKPLATNEGDNLFTDGKWWAGFKIASSRLLDDDFEGIAMYAKNGQGKETRIGKYTKSMIEVTALLAATGNAKETALDEVLLQINEYNDERTEQKKIKKEGGKAVGFTCTVDECKGQIFPLNEIELHTGTIDTVYKKEEPKEKPNEPKRKQK